MQEKALIRKRERASEAKKANDRRNSQIKETFVRLQQNDPDLIRFISAMSDVFGKPSQTPGAALGIKENGKVTLLIGTFDKAKL